jgi:hypothetical protein
MSGSSLVFKLYGDFHWPPALQPKSNPDRKRGCLEIHYAESGSGAAIIYRAYLVWKPYGVKQVDPGKPDDRSDSLYSQSNPVKWFEQNAYQSIWIDGPSVGNKPKDFVVFRGAYLFEQYTTDMRRELRWPLMPEYDNEIKPTIYSSFTITQATRKSGNTVFPRFDFDLSLPLPVNHSDDDQWAAYPLRAAFYPQVTKEADIGRINELFGRGFKKSAEINFQFTTPFANQRLGSFHLAAYGISDATCVSYYEKIKNNNTLEFYWPLKFESIIKNSLKAMGHTIVLDGTASPPIPGDFISSDFHLRVKSNGDENDSALAYRVKLRAVRSLSLTDLKEIEGPLNLGKIAHLDIYIRWTIDDSMVWTPETWVPRIGFRLYWNEGFETGFPTIANSSFAKRLLSDTFLKGNETRPALSFLENLQPASILPNIKTNFGAKDSFSFVLISEHLHGSCKEYFNTTGRQSSSFLLWHSHTPIHLTMTLADDQSKPESLFTGVIETGNNIKLTARLPAFSNTSPNGTAINLTLGSDEKWAQSEANAGDAASPYFASFSLNVTDVSNDTSRIGSLLFTIPKVSGLKIDPDFLRTAGRGLGGPQAFSYGLLDKGPDKGSGNGHVNATLRITLPVSAVIPLATDVARTDRTRRPAPLLIDLDEMSGTPVPKDSINYYLQVTETYGSDDDRLLTVSLKDNSLEQGQRDYLLLAEEPYSVLRFRQTRLGARGDAGSTEVAVYSSHDRLWQFRMVSPLYHFMLPPQAIGESADKPSRLELHDLTQAVSAPPHPYVDVDAGAAPPQEKTLKYRAVEFRLTPSTDLWVQPSDVARGYFIPEQASYDLFRQRGEYGLGAALAGLRGEFLYGLSVSIQVSKERSVARFTRVSEISALTGNIVGPAQEHGVDQAVSERWSRLSRAIVRRPERLELWARDPDSAVDFAPARFAEGTSFALRSTALHRPPLAEAEAQDESLPAEVPGQLRFHSNGLSGGALWPIESINLLNALKERPTSEGGTLEQVALAPFGGDGCQTAHFLNGVVRIISETRNGCIERQKVEIIGRIGCLWHRIKHVVVYERTVNPSAQFAPEFGTDQDKSRSRRPVLRKVREYVELIQPERLFPDFPQAAVRTTGFLDRVRFNSRIINVDSAWGSEVGTFGWQIPLWNRAAARQRPQVYSMPDIAFVTVSEGDDETPLVAQECLDPDMLYFFVDFKAGTSDTDLWQARLDVDFANLPLSRTIANTVDQPSSSRPVHNDTGNQRRPAVSRLLPGARRFTWRLSPAARKTAINAGRADKPIYVGLESVSFMRAAFGPRDQGEEKFAHLGALLVTSGNVDALSDQSLWEPGKASSLPNVDTAQYVQLLDQLTSLTDPAKVEETYKKLIDFWAALDAEGVTFSKSLAKALGHQAQQLHDAVKTDQNGKGLLNDIDKLGKKLAAGESGCQILKNNAIGQLRRKSLVICAVLQDWQAGIDSVLDKLPASLTKKDAIGKLEGAIKVLLVPIFKEASDDVGNVAEGVEKARAILLSVESDAQDLVTRALSRLAQLDVAYDRNKPWSTERRRAFRADVRSAVSSVVLDINGAINEARQRLSVELSDFAQTIASHLGRALSLLAREQSTALQGLGAMNVAIRRKLFDFVRLIDQLSPEAPPARGKLDLFIDAIGAVQTAVLKSDLGKDPAHPDHKDLRENVLKALDDLNKAALHVRDTEVKNVRAALNNLDKQNDDVIDSLAAIVTQLATVGERAINKLKDASSQALQYANDLGNAGFNDLQALLLACWPTVENTVQDVDKWFAVDAGFKKLLDDLDNLDIYVKDLSEWMRDALNKLLDRLRDLNATIDDAAASVGTVLDGLKQELAPENLLQRVVIDQVVRPALEEILAPLPDDLDLASQRNEIRSHISRLAEQVKGRLDALDQQALGALNQVSKLCEQVYGSIDQAAKDLSDLVNLDQASFIKKFDGIRKEFEDACDKGKAEIKNVVAAARALDYAVRNLQNDLSRTVETAQMYGNRVLAAASRLGEGDLMAAPSNILKLYSAVSSAPELLGMKSDIERIRAGFDDLSNIVDTTQAGALLNRMGDELKALGISSTFDKLSDRLLLNVGGCGLGETFSRIGGADLSKLFKGDMLRDSVGDAIRLTHDFDRQQVRAWVQVDIDAPFPGRHTLFSIGPFQCDFVDMQITGQMRLEASKDSEEMKQSGFGRIAATLDMMVSGQSMVSFDKFALNFTRESGLKIDFDPKNIRLNPTFQFVQEALKNLFPDMIGPLIIIKENGIPIGLEHEYVIPVISANAVTSGLSNLSIENRLRLVAYPEFVISDRFSLSRPERPFIFSLFILGGTGFIQIETEYRPFDAELTVTVDAAMGASALLGISAGPFSGQIFITLSAVLSYRKTIGRPGGGLAVSALLVIAGNVDVAGIATAGMYATLRMTYRDNGQVDADGTISVTIKISTFFTLSARASIQYRLRNGRAVTTTTSGVAVDSPKLKEATNKAAAAAEKIKGAMV